MHTNKMETVDILKGFLGKIEKCLKYEMEKP